MTFKPLLAGKAPADLRQLNFPLMASPKLDGIRCIKLDGKALSRTLKPIPNDYVRTWIEANLPDGIDGELMLRNMPEPRPTTVEELPEGEGTMSAFSQVSSAIMGKKGEPDFVFQAFDLLQPIGGEPLRLAASVPFHMRFAALSKMAENRPVLWEGQERLRVVSHVFVYDLTELQHVIDCHVREGYEGTMLRRPNGPYKFGRSTDREQILLKVKSFADEEATVIGVEEEMENTNTATTDALGRTERSTRKEGMRGKGRLGALRCRFEDGAEFTVGSGFTDAQRVQLWEAAREHEDLMASPCGLNGSLAKIKHQPPPGGRKPGEAPRFPVFLGFRED